jgi:hypothetical protein
MLPLTTVQLVLVSRASWGSWGRANLVLPHASIFSANLLSFNGFFPDGYDWNTLSIDQLHILVGYVFEGVETNGSLAKLQIACQTVAFSLNFI